MLIIHTSQLTFNTELLHINVLCWLLKQTRLFYIKRQRDGTSHNRKTQIILSKIRKKNICGIYILCWGKKQYFHLSLYVCRLFALERTFSLLVIMCSWFIKEGHFPPSKDPFMQKDTCIFERSISFIHECEIVSIHLYVSPNCSSTRLQSAGFFVRLNKAKAPLSVTGSSLCTALLLMFLCKSTTE